MSSYNKCVLPEMCGVECPYQVGFNGTEIQTVNESERTVTIFVQVDQGLDCEFKQKLSVEYVIKSYTAKEGLDFFGHKGQLTFDRFNRFAAITIDIVDDNLIEAYEFFSVELVNTNSRKVIYIEDNDCNIDFILYKFLAFKIVQ